MYKNSFFNLLEYTFSQLATWFFTTFTASDIKNKVISMRGVQYLYGTIFPDQLDIPSFIINYDIEVSVTNHHFSISVVLGHRSQFC